MSFGKFSSDKPLEYEPSKNKIPLLFGKFYCGTDYRKNKSQSRHYIFADDENADAGRPWRFCFYFNCSNNRCIVFPVRNDENQNDDSTHILHLRSINSDSSPRNSQHKWIFNCEFLNKPSRVRIKDITACQANKIGTLDQTNIRADFLVDARNKIVDLWNSLFDPKLKQPTDFKFLGLKASSILPEYLKNIIKENKITIFQRVALFKENDESVVLALGGIFKEDFSLFGRNNSIDWLIILSIDLSDFDLLSGSIQVTQNSIKNFFK